MHPWCSCGRCAHEEIHAVRCYTNNPATHYTQAITVHTRQERYEANAWLLSVSHIPALMNNGNEHELL